MASAGNGSGEATVGDRVIDASTGATPGYIDASNGVYAATPDGTGTGIGTFAGGELLAGATAYASFTGNSGGISIARINDDIRVGDDALIDVNVANLPEARAANTDGDAYATSDLKESYGLSQIDLSAGMTVPAVQLDADASASAAAVGDLSVSPMVPGPIHGLPPMPVRWWASMTWAAARATLSRRQRHDRHSRRSQLRSDFDRCGCGHRNRPCRSDHRFRADRQPPGRTGWRC